MQIKINKTSIEVLQGDLTQMETDAIVNAANERLAHGGGVAGAISRKGGPNIQQESDEWVRKHGTVITGTAAITSAGNLPAKFVIHAVGPIMGSGYEDAKLTNATLSSLTIADEYNLSSIAFPAISTGIFGYPMDRCAKFMLAAAKSYAEGITNITRIVFCLWDSKALETFEKELQTIA